MSELKPLSDDLKRRVSRLVIDGKPDAGTIYYFICPETIRVKVGFTAAAPEKRLAALQTGSPTKLQIITAHDGTMDDERAIHAEMSQSNTHGEWFDLDGPVEELVSFACYAHIAKNKRDGRERPIRECYWLWLFSDLDVEYAPDLVEWAESVAA